MPSASANEMAAQFISAYQALKDKKDAERFFALIRPMILAAKADGISDRELIDLINGLGLREKFYPAKLKELRSRLGKNERDAPVDGEADPSSSETFLHPLTAALSGRPDRSAL